MRGLAPMAGVINWDNVPVKYPARMDTPENLKPACSNDDTASLTGLHTVTALMSLEHHAGMYSSPRYSWHGGASTVQ